jgi:hypothetical protein
MRPGSLGDQQRANGWSGGLCIQGFAPKRFRESLTLLREYLVVNRLGFGWLETVCDVRFASIMIGVDTKNHTPSTMKTAYSYVRFSTPEQEMGDSERCQIALHLLLRKK